MIRRKARARAWVPRLSVIATSSFFQILCFLPNHSHEHDVIVLRTASGPIGQSNITLLQCTHSFRAKRKEKKIIKRRKRKNVHLHPPLRHLHRPRIQIQMSRLRAPVLLASVLQATPTPSHHGNLLLRGPNPNHHPAATTTIPDPSSLPTAARPSTTGDQPPSPHPPKENRLHSLRLRSRFHFPLTPVSPVKNPAPSPVRPNTGARARRGADLGAGAVTGRCYTLRRSGVAFEREGRRERRK